MKKIKRLVSLSLAIMLIALCALGSRVTVRADEVSAEDVFYWIKVNGNKIDLVRCPDMFTALKCNSTVTVEWKLKSGWHLDNEPECYEAESFETYGNIAEVTLSANTTASLLLSVANANNEDQYSSYDIYMVPGTPKLSIKFPWAGAGKQELLLENAGESQNYQVVSLTSGNPDVLRVTKKSTLYACTATPKNAGKSKVTLVVKLNGKNRTFTGTITVKKYPNPFTSIKVAGKAVDLKKNKYTYTLRGSSAKVFFKLNSGWKLTDAYYVNSKYHFRDFISGDTIKRGTSNSVNAYILVRNNKKQDFCYKITLTK